MVELWKLSDRYKEEIILLEREMETFLKCIDRTIQKLKSKIPKSTVIKFGFTKSSFLNELNIYRFQFARIFHS